MSEVKILQCDGCGKTTGTDNFYEAGWIKVEGEISIANGKFNKERGSYDAQWINAKDDVHHFCSWKCLQGHNDNKRPKEKKMKNEESGTIKILRGIIGSWACQNAIDVDIRNLLVLAYAIGSSQELSIEVQADKQKEGMKK